MGLSKTNRAVRLLGLKLLLWSSFAVIASGVGPPAAQDFAQATFAGMKLGHLILGTMGAGVSLLFLPQFSGLVLGRTVFAGVLAALVGTPLAAQMIAKIYESIVGLPAPDGTLENVIAVVLGVGGVYLMPALQTAWKKNPFGIVDFVRDFGRGKQPPPGGQP